MSIAASSTGTVIVQVFFPRGKRPLPAFERLVAKHDGEITVDDPGPPRNLFLSFGSEKGATAFFAAIPKGVPIVLGNVFHLEAGAS